MLTGALLLTNNLAFAKKKYLPVANIKTLSFNIQSDSINEFLENSHLLKNNHVYGEVSWEKSKGPEVKVVSKKKLPEDLTTFLEDFFLSKSRIIWKTDYDSIPEDYKLVENSGGWKSYEDNKLQKDIVRISIQEENEMVKIIEKKPVGTSMTYLSYKKQKWSENEDVLVSIERKVYEGSQNFKTVSDIAYKKIKNHWLPEKITIVTTHKAATDGGKKISRKINEQIIFSNYKI